MLVILSRVTYWQVESVTKKLRFSSRVYFTWSVIEMPGEFASVKANTSSGKYRTLVLAVNQA